MTDLEQRYREEAEYESQIAVLYMTYDCEDPADLKIIKQKLKEIEDQ